MAVEKARRRRRDRRKAKEAESSVTSPTEVEDFDEQAYLQGRLGIINDPSQVNTLQAQGSMRDTGKKYHLKVEQVALFENTPKCLSRIRMCIMYTALHWIL